MITHDISDHEQDQKYAIQFRGQERSTGKYKDSWFVVSIDEDTCKLNKLRDVLRRMKEGMRCQK